MLLMFCSSPPSNTQDVLRPDYVSEGLRSTFWPSPRKLLSVLHAQPYREGGNPVVWEG